MEKRKRSYSQWLRFLAQAVFVGIMAYVGLRHQIVKATGGWAPPIDMYCPFGAVETMGAYITTGSFLQKTAMTNFIVFSALIALILITGGSFCSHVCPLGAIQEWLAKISKKIVKRQLVPGAAADRVLRSLRFVVLGIIVFYTVKYGYLIFEKYDPFKNLFHFKFESWVAYGVIALTIGTSLLIDRFWCRYLCPLGAIVQVLNKFSLIKIKRDEDACIDCSRCSKICVMNIPVARVASVNHGDCTMCMECLDVCPVEGALDIKTRWTK